MSRIVQHRAYSSYRGEFTEKRTGSGSIVVTHMKMTDLTLIDSLTHKDECSDTWQYQMFSRAA